MPNYYLVRPYPNGVNRIREFKERECIGIGWPDQGDVSGMSKAQLRDALEEYYAVHKGREKLRSTLGTFNVFCLEIKVGDYIIAPENQMGSIHIAKVTSDYYYDKDAYALDFAHQRKVEWLDAVIPRSRIAELGNERLERALKFPGTAASLREYYRELEILVDTSSASGAISKNADPMFNNSKLMKTSYPLRPDVYCELSFPSDMTQEETTRLATFVSTLSFTPHNKET